MSLYFWFECLSHDPPLRSSEEISQHDDEFVVAAVRLAQGLPPVPGRGLPRGRAAIETRLADAHQALEAAERARRHADDQITVATAQLAAYDAFGGV